jgi:predicted transcriptional regulator
VAASLEIKLLQHLLECMDKETLAALAQILEIKPTVVEVALVELASMAEAESQGLVVQD